MAAPCALIQATVQAIKAASPTGAPVAESQSSLSDEFILARFKHLYEQYFDGGRLEIRVDGEGARSIYAEYTHQRFKHSWLPRTFCGIRVQCEPSPQFAQMLERAKP